MAYINVTASVNTAATITIAIDVAITAITATITTATL